MRPSANLGSPKPATVYLGLGSNLGDRRTMLMAAARRLDALPEVSVTKASSLYETEPVGYKDQPWFLNAVLEAVTTLGPSDLLQRVKLIERELGRREGPRWGPRAIDVDILLYLVEEAPGALLRCVLVEEENLRLPHEMMTERLFVMLPLAEIAPDVRLPGGRTVAEVARELDEVERVIRVGDLSWKE